MLFIAFKSCNHVLFFVFVVANDALFIRVSLAQSVKSNLLQTPQNINRSQLVVPLFESSLDHNIDKNEQDQSENKQFEEAHEDEEEHDCDKAIAFIGATVRIF